MKITNSKLSKILILALMLSLSLADSITSAKTSKVSSSTTASKPKYEAKIVPNRYIVTCGSTNLPSAVRSRVSSLKGQITSTFDGAGIAVITSDNPNFATEISKIAGVTSVVPDKSKQWIDPDWSRKLIPLSDINPPFSDNQNQFFNLQWGLDAINAPEAWKTGARGRGALVAVLDTGFDLDHPDIQPNVDFEKSRSFVPTEGLEWSGPETEFSHGTHVAGIIAAVDDDVGVVGVAPEAKLMLVKVLRDSDGYGVDSWILAGLKYAIDQGADIINLSLGGYDFIDSPSTAAFKQMMIYANRKGVTVIAAAGNDAYDLDEVNRLGNISLPGQSPNVLAVSATAPIGWIKAPLITSFDNIASYSNFGSSIDFAAPGGDDRYAGPEDETITIFGEPVPVYALDLVFSSVNDGWGWSGGTSMAAPHVAGVAALVVGKSGGKMSPEQLKRILQSSSSDLGNPGHDVYYGYGRVNAYRAVLSCK